MKTENERRFAAIKAQQERARAWGELSPKLRIAAASWPEALKVEEIALLHAYRDGRTDATSAEDMAEYLEQCIEHGELVESKISRLERVPSELGQGPDSETWRRECTTITAKECARALRGIEPGPYLRLWLAPFLGCAETAAEAPAQQHQGEAAAPAKPKRETQADRVARWLTECERRAADAGEPFERSNMPGTKAEFRDLLHALDADLKSIKTVDSLDRYLSVTGCKWPLDASAQPSAAPLYARLFPEARIRTPGVVSPQRRKA